MSVSHARLRNNCSNLNNDLFINHLRERPFCSWCNVIEDAKHYFFPCNQYRNERLLFFEAVRDFQLLFIKLFLLGNDTLNNTSNITLFRAHMSISRILKDLILNEHVCKVGLFKVIYPKGVIIGYTIGNG